jgi:hypothetical protein
MNTTNKAARSARPSRETRRSVVSGRSKSGAVVPSESRMDGVGDTLHLMLIVAGVVIRAGVFAPDTLRSTLDEDEGRRDRRRASERSADGLPDQVRDECGGATEGELPQSAADSRALGEGTHPDAEQEQRGKGDDDTADER